MAGRPKIKPIESIPLSNIIFLVARGINYPHSASKKLGNNPSALTRQFKLLKKEEILKEVNEDSNRFNIKKYEINYEEIINLFIEEFFENIECEKKYGKIPENLKLAVNDFKKEDINSLKKDEPTIDFFNELFKSISLDKRSIKDIFQHLYLNPPKIKTTNKSFIKFVKILSNYSLDFFLTMGISLIESIQKKE
jgi:hypothetical protein